MDIGSLINSADAPRPAAATRRQSVSALLNEPSEPGRDERTTSQTSRESQASDEDSTPQQDEAAQKPKEIQEPQQQPKPEPQRHKPRRYDSPPVWAQSYRLVRKRMKRDNRLDNSGVPPYAAASNGGPPPPPGTGGPAGGSANVEGGTILRPSITGVVPFVDMTRKIAEWLYSNLLSMDDQDRRNVEVEIKFGTIADKATQRRLDLPVTTETLLQPAYAQQRTRFVASLQDDQFRHANEMLDGLAGGSSPTLQRLPALRTRDSVFASRDGGGKIRVTHDESGENVVARINKRRVADIMVYSPGDLVDFRLSLNVETPVGPGEQLAQTPSTIRNKNRQSYRAPGMQFDLTSVISPSSSGDSVSKELEVELDGPQLVRLFDAYRLHSDAAAMDQFEELLHQALDNTRAIARKLSR